MPIAHRKIKAVCKVRILYDSNYVAFLRSQKYSNGKRSWLPGDWEGGAAEVKHWGVFMVVNVSSAIL